MSYFTSFLSGRASRRDQPTISDLQEEKEQWKNQLTNVLEEKEQLKVELAELQEENEQLKEELSVPKEFKWIRLVGQEGAPVYAHLDMTCIDMKEKGYMEMTTTEDAKTALRITQEDFGLCDLCVGEKGPFRVFEHILWEPNEDEKDASCEEYFVFLFRYGEEDEHKFTLLAHRDEEDGVGYVLVTELKMKLYDSSPQLLQWMLR
jgi:hypothetical protein